jgi:hypothetical protein
MQSVRTVPAFRVEYHHNNSGGRDWMSDSQWAALERAGWTLDRLGALSGRIYGASIIIYGDHSTETALQRGMEIWTDVTGANRFAEGCECCGRPHSFYCEVA